ncbi:MAG: enoyl-CoA hydratase-related protein, partial [Acidimicrobiales bacterium]
MSADNLIDLRYDTAGGVATITIDRPDRHNAMRPNTLREMAQVLTLASDDAAIGVVVITGAGER